MKQYKQRWKVSHTYAGGEFFYQVYRIRDLDQPDHAGNRDTYHKCFDTEEQAQAFADKLNCVGDDSDLDDE